MNQYLLHDICDHSVDEERLKILYHSPYLFANFQRLLCPIKTTEKGGFIYLYGEYRVHWDWNMEQYYASKGGYPTIVNLMIMKSKAIVPWCLQGACEGGDLNMVDYVINRGSYHYNYGLEGACKAGNMYLVNMMIEGGADAWSMGLSGACGGGHRKLVNLMIEKGAKNWNRGLVEATMGGHLDIVKLMIEKGADYLYGGIRDACKGGHLDIFNYILSKIPVTPNLRGPEELNWALYYTCLNKNPTLMHRLISECQKWHINLNWNLGLEGACVVGDPDLVNFMIKKGANAWDNCLYFACQRGHPKIVKIMIENGAVWCDSCKRRSDEHPQ
jgi:hypothetical protein